MTDIEFTEIMKTRIKQSIIKQMEYTFNKNEHIFSQILHTKK